MSTEAGTRVPLIAWMPGTIEAGIASDVLVTSVDFYPTLADFAGPETKNGTEQVLDGVSFKSVLLGTGEGRDRRTIYWHFPGYLDNRAKPCSAILKCQQRGQLHVSLVAKLLELEFLHRRRGPGLAQNSFESGYNCGVLLGQIIRES